MRDAIETIEYKGYEIGLFQDESAESPREWDNLGTMLCLHPRYDLGDKHELDAKEIIEISNRKDVLALPLVLLDHSGLWMKVWSGWAEDPGGWDTPRVGIIYVTYEKIKKEYSCKYITKKVLAKAERLMRAEVKEYSSYLEGAVCGWVVEDKDGEVIESVWGYYGGEGWDRAIAEAKECIDYRVSDELYQKRMGEQMELFGEEVRR